MTDQKRDYDDTFSAIDAVKEYISTDWADKKEQELIFDAYGPGGAYGRWITDKGLFAQALRDERERRTQNTWQPMATIAPLNEEKFLGADHGEVYEMWWDANVPRWVASVSNSECWPTRWRPLPEPPEEEQDE